MTIQPASSETTPPPENTGKRFSWFKFFPKIPSIFPKKPKPPAAVPPHWVGTIRMVNTAEKFVLIESNSLSSIIPGENYLAISNGNETASLRMTSLKNPPFLIADITSGNPSTGEKIYLPKSTASPESTPLQPAQR